MEDLSHRICSSSLDEATSGCHYASLPLPLLHPFTLSPSPAWVAVLWTSASKSGGSSTVSSPADAAKSAGFLAVTKVGTCGNRFCLTFQGTKMAWQTNKSCTPPGCLPRYPPDETEISSFELHTPRSPDF